jgi:hypothetical protein
MIPTFMFSPGTYAYKARLDHSTPLAVSASTLDWRRFGRHAHDPTLQDRPVARNIAGAAASAIAGDAAATAPAAAVCGVARATPARQPSNSRT